MNSKPKISLFTMKACGYCTQAKQMFAAELASGEMIEKPASEAPQGTRGFPTFTADNKTHSGLPQTKKQLYEKLDIGISKEKYKNVYGAGDDPNDNIDVNNFIDSTFPNYSAEVAKCLYIPLTKNLNISGIILETQLKNFSLVYKKEDSTKQRKTLKTALYTKDNLKSVSTEQEKKFLTKTIFPCTSNEDWDNIFNSTDYSSLTKYVTSIRKKLMPPQQCDSDPSVYCCPGTTGPKAVFCPPCTDPIVCKKHKFFDIKTIFMICFILLLLSILLYVIMNSSSSSGVTSVLSSGTSSISSNK